MYLLVELQTRLVLKTAETLPVVSVDGVVMVDGQRSAICPAETEIVEVASVPSDGGPWKHIDGAFVSALAPRWTSIPDAQSNLVQQIEATCEKLMAAIKTSYPASEVSTWDQQVREALDYQADPLMTVPLIGNMATARGLTKDELVGRILLKATAFAGLAGQIIGRRQALEDAIMAATTLDALTLIEVEINTGWPV